ncbi:MAG: HD domain-containing protein, partial [Planctomycetes bacterium]|nr:HD domain-containing protein [Planctomycetota bacterium]
MAKHEHEFRDPIHVFIRVSSDERRVIDSRAFQRLRHIHQLALTYLVYPGATHRRFEHSLGVMELAGRVFDVVTHPANIVEAVRQVLPDSGSLAYWRKVLRIAALMHDIGHLPFSHAAEADLLPKGWNHERLTEKLIDDVELSGLFGKLTPPVKKDDVKKLAVGRKHLKKITFSAWDELLSEIITGDVFGVSRMDYLLRDAYHCGVAYGRFDHYRLVDCLRILPKHYAGTDELALGIDEGGLHSAEALLLARYFMFTQVYLHPVRRIYDIHLQDFLKDWLTKGKFETTAAGHLKFTDNEVTAAIRAAAGKRKGKGVDAARRIVTREHFKLC